MPGHIVLVGDSIFDNARYTGGEPDVVSHLRRVVPPGWRASLLAVDGAITSDVPRQARSMPSDATHLVVSVGGNDALMNSDLLATRVTSTAEALTLFASRSARFEQEYRRTIDAVESNRVATTLCTIYNGNLEPERRTIARLGLMIFNDAILRVAFERRHGVIDLRLVCSEPADYANPIEPSGEGGRKIAAAIARATGAVDAGPPTRVFT